MYKYRIFYMCLNTIFLSGRTCSGEYTLPHTKGYNAIMLIMKHGEMCFFRVLSIVIQQVIYTMQKSFHDHLNIHFYTSVVVDTRRGSIPTMTRLKTLVFEGESFLAHFCEGLNRYNLYIDLDIFNTFESCLNLHYRDMEIEIFLYSADDWSGCWIFSP